ncbi:hypothetical protein ACIOHC_35825 [Streptomyces sp. NPDC088252]|uniref:hypothetical protein n=1 Tax=Streptomyces sp. NPDC088252 TaxID=3365845 RepID=UPI0037F2E164
MSQEDAPSLADHVAQAIRIHDGAHDKGAGQLAEIALSAAAEFFRRRADSAPDATSRTLRLYMADQLDPEVQ